MKNKRGIDLVSITILFQFLFMFFLAVFYRNSVTIMILYTLFNFLITIFSLQATNKKIGVKFLLLFFFLVLVSLIHLSLFRYSIWIELLVLSNFAIIYFYFKNLISNGYIKQIINTLKFIIILFLLISILEGIIKDNPFITRFGADSGINEVIRTRGTVNYLIRGTMEHPLIISFFCIFSTPFLFLYRNRIIRTGLIIFMIFTAFVTYKRTSMVLVLVLVFLGYMGKIIILDKEKFPTSKIIKVISLFIFMFLVVYLVPIFGETLYERIYNQFLKLETYNKYSIIHRSSSIELGLTHFFESNLLGIFIGNGYRSLSNYFSSNTITISVDGFYVIDNSYVTMLNDFGVVGIMFFIIINIKSVILGIKKFRSSDDRKVKYFYYLVTLSLIFCAGQIFFFDFMNWFQPIFCYALLISLLNSEYSLEEEYFYEKIKYKEYLNYE